MPLNSLHFSKKPFQIVIRSMCITNTYFPSSSYSWYSSVNLVQVVEAMLRATGRTIWAQKWNLRLPLPVYPQCRPKVNVSTLERNENVQVCHYSPSCRCEMVTATVWHLFEVEAPHLFWSRDSRTCRSFKPVLFNDSIEPIRERVWIIRVLEDFH